MPLYNGIEFLEEAVASLLKQTYPFWHLIIGVNGHPAGSEVFQRAKRFESDRIEVREYPATRGAPTTLSAMAQDARYDLVSLLDADDGWLPRKLERQGGGTSFSTTTTCGCASTPRVACSTTFPKF